MSFWVEQSIADDPNNEQPDCNHAQRMAVKKRVTMFGHVELLAFRLLLACKDMTPFSHSESVTTRMRRAQKSLV